MQGNVTKQEKKGVCRREHFFEENRQLHITHAVSRYYQGVIDVDSLKTGYPYTELRASYILFICLFDPFGEGLPCYSFENVCTENSSLRLNDRAYKIFYNAKSCATIGNNESLQNFLEFVGKGTCKQNYVRVILSATRKFTFG